MHQKQPLLWVPSLYLLQGIPYMAVTLLPIVAYKNLGITNISIIIITSLFTLPWILKPLFSSWVESALTQRQWTYSTEIGIGLLFFLLGMVIHLHHFFVLSIICFLLIGTLSALHDIASDGIYLNALDLKKQYSLMGVRNGSYQCARLLIQGGIVALAGIWLIQYSAQTAWSRLFILIGILMITLGFYHKRSLPLQTTITQQANNYLQHFKDTTKLIVKAWFQLPMACLTIVFLLVYNACDAQLLRITPLFFITKSSQGGLGFNNIFLGFNQALGIIAFILGSFAISYLLKRLALNSLLIWSYALLILSHTGYVFLAFHTDTPIIPTNGIYFIAQMSFGFANGAYMAYLMHLANTQKFRAAFYAITTAVMSLSFMLFGFLSAPIIHLLQFKMFFIWVLFLGVAVFIYTVYFIKRGFAS